MLTLDESSFYSQFQKDVLEARLSLSYRTIRRRYGFSSEQQLHSFIYRTVLGFRLESTESPAGPIPIVPGIILKNFKNQCLEQAIDFNCLYASKAIYILDELLAERTIRSYQLATELRCPYIASDVLTRYEETMLTSQWFNEFCAEQGLRLLNPQSLEQLRSKFCNINVLTKFYDMLRATIHQYPHLLYNMDETSCCTNKEGKIVVPEGKCPFVSEEKSAGHITSVCTCNAAGEALKLLIILPMFVKLPEELKQFQSQCYFATTPSGWMSSRIFTIWAILFSQEIIQRRQQLVTIYGPSIVNEPCFLFVDGHKSRLNSAAIEILYLNNIRVIVLPAHTSHVTQPFDVAIAGPYKTFLKQQSLNIPNWLHVRISTLCPTAQKRYILVLSVIDSWKKAATTINIEAAWTKTGLYPFNPDIVKENKYVKKPEEINTNNPSAPTPKRNAIEINALELTTLTKRIELSRHCSGNPF